MKPSIWKAATAGLLGLSIAGASAEGEPWQWTQETTIPAPSPRFAHSMSFDSSRNVIVLFGGQANVQFGSGPVNAETW